MPLYLQIALGIVLALVILAAIPIVFGFILHILDAPPSKMTTVLAATPFWVIAAWVFVVPGVVLDASVMWTLFTGPGPGPWLAEAIRGGHIWQKAFVFVIFPGPGLALLALSTRRWLLHRHRTGNPGSGTSTTKETSC